jgi:ribonucleoside-diphosphate reductase alpha chain
MQVVKRNGKIEEVKFDKISHRIKSLAHDLKVDPAFLTQRTVTGLYDKIPTSKIDTFLSETAAVLSSEHPDYAKLAARLATSCLHKETHASFYQTTKQLFKHGILSDDYLAKVKANADAFERMIDYGRDFQFDYFGFKTLERSYLLRIDGKIVERPQHLFMRVAIAVCGRADQDCLAEVESLYSCLSLGLYTHATPTLFNAGTKRPQLSSCFLLGLEDSIDGIFDTLKECAQISKYAGGIGLHVTNIRASGSRIHGTNGVSSGILPMLKVFNETARYVDQAGRRKGSFAIYLEPWHADVEQFLDLKKPTGKEELRARDLFLALWVPDLFMERVEQDLPWTLMCPAQQPGLSDVHGEKFKALYEQYEQQFPSLKRMPARELMTKIIESMMESGTPYILFKDACNSKSNQQNIGTIKSSNLCAEILEVSDANESAVCNLASVCLPAFVDENEFDFDKLETITRLAVKNLNQVIDRNFYPTDKTAASNRAHRPIGLGVQGLADVFFKLRLPFASPAAKALDEQILATMYHAALDTSCDLAKDHGPYSTFNGSPLSQGLLQFDLWGSKGDPRYDWDALRAKVKQHGVRNSLLIALMPTASTSQIFGNTEAFEPITSNLYKRQTLAGEFVVVNKHLIQELEHLGLWDAEMRDKIVQAGGSVQGISEIPADVKEIFKTVWELSQRDLIDHAAARGPYVCQSQSMNLFFSRPSFGTINSALFYSWKKGLKTGAYYTRTRPSTEAVKVTTKIEDKQEAVACSIENPDACIVCQ